MEYQTSVILAAFLLEKEADVGWVVASPEQKQLQNSVETIEGRE